MECWKCNYFYVSTKDEPCNKCLNKSCFLLWESKKLKDVREEIR